MKHKYSLLVILFSMLTTLGCGAASAKQNDKSDSKQPLTITEKTYQLHADFNNEASKIGEVFDFFDVSVRTQRGSPQSTPATFGRRAKVNTVRMLGGWADKNLNADTYKWDGEKFIYDFSQATKRIDGWLAKNWDIFQIVLDNPPWAFQRGFTFVDKPDGKHYLKKDANGVYGNGLPPADSEAWHNYIQAFISHLTTTYGKETVLNWRFRVGSEIDTRPQHWAGTRQEFFDHYQNTVNAIHAVLPNAQVGAHFREASFKGRYVDYTGNTEDSYATHFLTWAKKHNVPYDFFAISYYPHIDKPHELDMEHVYQHEIAPIQQHPDWNKKASFEIHEFKLISKMLRAGFVSVSTSHSSSFFAMLSKLMLEKNIKEIFQWGTASNGSYIPEAMTQLALHSMIGNQLFLNTVTTPNINNQITDNNIVDGIFTKHPAVHHYEVLTFNFNKHNLNEQSPEQVLISMGVNKPVGTQYQYRIASIDSTNNVSEQFYAEFPKANILEKDGGWRKPNFILTASPSKALNAEGKKVYLQNKRKYGKTDKLIWGNWQSSQTINNQLASSMVNIKAVMPSFSVQKIQVNFAD